MTITEQAVLDTLKPLLESAETRAVVLNNGHEDLGAIISMRDYEDMRQVKAQRLLASLDALGAEVRRNAEEQGISLDEVERMLDRKQP